MFFLSTKELAVERPDSLGIGAGTLLNDDGVQEASGRIGPIGRVQNVRHEVAGGNCLYHGTTPTAE